MNDKELAYQYSWNWFKYHAQQRYSAFNYYLLVIGALAYSYIQSNCFMEFKVAIGILGLLISIAFLFIEIRNNELVNDGRAALDLLEREETPFKKYSIRRCDNKYHNDGGLFKHKIWFRFVIIVGITMSAVAIMYALKSDWIYILTWAFFIAIVSFLFACCCEKETKEIVLPLKED